MCTYDYTIAYWPGSRIDTADAISSLPLQRICLQNVQTPGCIIHLKAHLGYFMVDSINICKDSVLSRVV